MVTSMPVNDYKSHDLTIYSNSGPPPQLRGQYSTCALKEDAPVVGGQTELSYLDLKCHCVDLQQ